MKAKTLAVLLCHVCHGALAHDVGEGVEANLEAVVHHLQQMRLEVRQGNGDQVLSHLNGVCGHSESVEESFRLLEGSRSGTGKLAVLAGGMAKASRNCRMAAGDYEEGRPVDASKHLYRMRRALDDIREVLQRDDRMT